MTLNIFGQKVRVLKQKNLMSEKGIFGEYNPNTNIITVDSELVGDDFMHTVLHEFCHGVVYRTGIYQALRELGVEEIICENIPRALIENFKIKLK